MWQTKKHFFAIKQMFQPLSVRAEKYYLVKVNKLNKSAIQRLIKDFLKLGSSQHRLFSFLFEIL